VPPLLPHNKKIAKLFDKLNTQWNRNQMDGSIMGLNYQSLEFVARATRFEVDDIALKKIRAIEEIYILESRRSSDGK
jgi:Phage related hypothetical protein (DUF1799)